MEVIVCGASGGEVTGSAYLIKTAQAQVLLDFGAFQGSREAEALNILPEEIVPEKLSAVILTHAHLDHVGRLPLLTKHGYKGPVFATSATAMITDISLKDAAHLQAADAERQNRKQGGDAILPLYTLENVEALHKLYRDLPYDQVIQLAPGIAVRAREAGHILGSVSLEVTVDEDGRQKVVVFSGDLGPRGAPLLKDPVPFTRANLVFMESTYGDRDHRSLEETVSETREIIRQAVAQKGKMLMPVFAIGRAQLMLYLLAGEFQRGSFPPFPVFLDSPMAMRTSEVYRQNLALFDEEALEMYRSGKLATHLQTLYTCQTAAESKALNSMHGPCLIMAGSGMCTGGRIVHHLRHNLANPSTHVLIVGYQAEGTLGRRLVDGAKLVRIFGEDVVVRASVHSLGGFSAHAGQTDLMHWLSSIAPAKPKVALTHGEDRARIPLAQKIEAELNLQVLLPRRNERFVL